MVSYHGDAAEIVPVPQAERAVIPQRLKLKAGEILPDDIERRPRLSEQLSANDKWRSAGLLSLEFAGCWV